MGMLLRYIQLKEPTLSLYNRAVILSIAQYSIGYCRPTTKVPADLGYDRNSQTWADNIGISKSTFLRSIKELSSLNLIKVHKGSLYRTDGGSYPDYYSIIFDTELQTKYSLFFNISGVSKLPKYSKPPQPKLLPLPPVTDYMVLNGRITLLSQRDPGQYETLVNRGLLAHPDKEQLLAHLNQKGILYELS